jgi:hypothetical protein
MRRRSVPHIRAMQSRGYGLNGVARSFADKGPAMTVTTLNGYLRRCGAMPAKKRARAYLAQRHGRSLRGATTGATASATTGATTRATPCIQPKTPGAPANPPVRLARQRRGRAPRRPPATTGGICLDAWRHDCAIGRGTASPPVAPRTVYAGFVSRPDTEDV